MASWLVWALAFVFLPPTHLKGWSKTMPATKKVFHLLLCKQSFLISWIFNEIWHNQLYLPLWITFFLKNNDLEDVKDRVPSHNGHKLFYKDMIMNMTITLNMRGLSYPSLTRSILWLLVPWVTCITRSSAPMLQTYKIGRSLSSMKNIFNYLCHVSMDER